MFPYELSARNIVLINALTGKLLMKSRALSVSPDRPCREVRSGMAEKNRVSLYLVTKVASIVSESFKRLRNCIILK